MKKAFKVLGIIVFVAIIGFSMAACSSSPPSPSPKWANVVYYGEEERQLEGTSWVSTLQMTNTRTGASEVIKAEFRRGGRLVTNLSDNASWQRKNDIVEFVVADGQAYFEGIYYHENQKILGTLYFSSGTKQDTTFTLIDSSITTASSSLQNNAQSPAPAQAASSAPSAAQRLQEAFSSPLQSGTYSLSGTQAKMSITAIAKSGILSYTNRQGRVSTGSYQIDGSRMTIQAEGYTFVYTITSQTSFSGNGETWVRTGF